MTEPALLVPPVGASIVVADPPWPHDNYALKKHGAQRNHYKGMSVAELSKFPMRDHCSPGGAILFMWCTGPKMAEAAALDVAKAWGFIPRTKAFCWVKVAELCRACGHPWGEHAKPLWDLPGRCLHAWKRKGTCACPAFVPRLKPGPGNYTCAGTEDVWLCKSKWGRAAWAKDRARKDVRGTFMHPLVGKGGNRHSSKPEVVQDRIEMLWPVAGPRMELFGRRLRPGWEVYGNALGYEVGEFGIRRAA